MPGPEVARPPFPGTEQMFGVERAFVLNNFFDTNVRSTQSVAVGTSQTTK